MNEWIPPRPIAPTPAPAPSPAQSNRAFLEAVAAACGLDLGRVTNLNIDFKAPHEFGVVTVRTFVAEGLNAVVQTFRLEAVETLERQKHDGQDSK